MPWSKILKIPKLFGRNLFNHHSPSSSKCSSLSSSSRPLSVPFLFRTWLARPGDVGKVKQKFPWLKNCFYLRAVQLFSMRQPVDPELSLLVLFNIRQHILERMKNSHILDRNVGPKNHLYFLVSKFVTRGFEVQQHGRGVSRSGGGASRHSNPSQNLFVEDPCNS